MTIMFDLSEVSYHSDPALSSTGARKLLESPARYQHYIHTPQEPKAVFDLGTATHSKVLGVGSGVIAYPEEHLTASGNVSTKAATVQWAAEQRAAGVIPISPDDAARVDAMAEAVLAHHEARRILEHTQHRETSLFATDPATGVNIRARFDIYGDDECGDLKTARDASPRGFTRAVYDHRYDVQQEHYLKTRELHGHGRVPFTFIAVESAAPYLVGVYTLNDQWQEIGDVWATAARKIFRACTDADVWPGYGTDVHELIPPMGLIYEHADRFESQEITV